MLHRTPGRIELLRAPDGVDGAAVPTLPVERDLSDAEAVEMLIRRREGPTTNDAPATPSEAGAGPDESGDEPDAAPPDGEPSGETEGEGDPAREPPIDPPRSWTKADKEVFATLPRETQQRLVEIDRARELEVRKGQNEVAERTKAADAERQAAEKARQRYEAALPTAITVLQAEIRRDFPDVKSIADIRKLEPARYVEFKKRADLISAYSQEHSAAQQRREQELVDSFTSYTAEQGRLFIEKAPEFADPEKGPKLQAAIARTLETEGFTPDELEAAWSRGVPISMRDHRVQLIVRKAMLYDQAQEALKKAAPKSSPAPVRPSAPPSRGEAAAGKVEELRQKLAHTGSDRDAVALLRARREAGARRAG